MEKDSSSNSKKISSMEDALVFLGHIIEEIEPAVTNNYSKWLNEKNSSPKEEN